MAERRPPFAVAIDGPASSGKGTVARAVAQRLDFAYIDTGAMYRAVSLRCRRAGLDLDDGPGCGALAARLRFQFTWRDGALTVTVDGEDVSAAIRGEAEGQGASRVSRHPRVRDALLALQRGLAAAGDVVMDGRDIGTVVLPDAPLKIYLDAELSERAHRRHREQLDRGLACAYDDVRRELAARDAQDMGRAVAPLRAAADAVVMDTTTVAPAEAAERIVALIRDRRGDR